MFNKEDGLGPYCGDKPMEREIPPLAVWNYSIGISSVYKLTNV